MVRHGPRFGGRALSGIGPLAAYADAPPRYRIGVRLWRQPEPQTILWLSGSFQLTPDQYQNDPKRHVPFLAGGQSDSGAPAFADGLESAGHVYELCPVC